MAQSNRYIKTTDTKDSAYLCLSEKYFKLSICTKPKDWNISGHLIVIIIIIIIIFTSVSVSLQASMLLLLGKYFSSVSTVCQ